MPRVGVIALLVLVGASAVLLQPFGYNQGSHLALVRALADGTPRIDAYRDYSGDESYYHGHFYSNKAPGLALASLPAYVALRAAHLPHGVHALSLWGVLLAISHPKPHHTPRCGSSSIPLYLSPIRCAR